MTFNITDAAEAAGVSRSTIYDRVRSGQLSKRADGRIDAAELLRVFGELREVTPSPAGGSAAATIALDAALAAKVAAEEYQAAATAEAAWLRELVDEQRTALERKDRELHALVERAAAERQGLLAQITQVTALLPAPEPAAPRGFWQRAFGR